MKTIVANEWKNLGRDKGLLVASVFFAAVLIAVSIISVKEVKQSKDNQQKAQQHMREKWEAIDSMNAHSAAHYGTYLYKPVTAIGNFDEGVYNITGKVLRIEGHVQNEIVYSEASQSLLLSKFGKLKSSLILQYIIPLLLIFLAFNSMSNEKESGRVKLLYLQGATTAQLIISKSIAIWIYGVLLLLITFCTQLLSLPPHYDQTERLVLLFMAFALYYYIIVIGTIYLSAKLKNNTAVLTMSLACWMLWTIFLPKILGNTSEKAFRLPSRQAFQTAMQEDRAKGIDGHNPSDKREKELKEKVLKEYNVTDVKDLPINYDGIRMQADEEYGNQVWDKHFGNNYTLLKKQKTFYQLSGIINPFISLQNLSMGLCGTDMYHHIHFLQQAELYRRNFIKMLNDRHAFGGSKTGEWEWTEKNEFFKSIKDFEYRNPALGSLLESYRIDLLCLIGWAALITTIVLFKEKKKEYV